MTSKRNYCLLLFEIIAACLVVFIHLRMPKQVGVNVEMFARFAVPLFYVISGFFLMKLDMDNASLRKRMIKKIIHIAILTLISFLIYFVICLIRYRNNIPGFFRGYYKAKYILQFFLFNRPFLSSHNWFLLALLYSYIFIWICPYIFTSKKKIGLYIISALSIVALILRLYAYRSDVILFELKVSDNLFYRNWLLTGLPFICLGALLRHHQESLKKINIYIALLGLILSGLLMMQEMYIYRYIMKSHLEYCFFNIVFVFFIIIISIKKPLLFSKSKFLNIKGNWTTYVYIIHPAYIYYLNKIFSENGLDNEVSAYFKPFIVLVISLLTALLINFIVNYIKNKIELKKQTV